MSEFAFPPPPPASAPIQGRAERFPLYRIFCVGRNYEAHAKEMGAAVDREAPFYFTKAAGHYAPSGAAIAYPPGTSSYHHEMEFVVAIGKAGFRIAEAQALEHVFGYACGLDMTRRDLQAAAKEKQRPWDLGKDVEQSAVLGEIAPATAIGHPTRGRIELRVNGQTRQSSDVSMLIHSVPAVIAHLSQVLPPAARRSHLHRHAGGCGRGEAGRSARGLHRRRRYDCRDAERSRLRNGPCATVNRFVFVPQSRSVWHSFAPPPCA